VVVGKCPKDGLMTEFPVTDFLDLLKNAQSRIMSDLVGFVWACATISEISIFKEPYPESTERAFTARGDLDAMRENSAVQVFTMKTLPNLAEIGGKEGSQYLLPFVCLCRAIWNRYPSPEVRVA
jgi:hypothetical protein